MDRRKSLKSIVLGSVATGLAVQGCKVETEQEPVAPQPKDAAWRTAYENKMLKDVKAAAPFFNAHQRETMMVLCDLILPASDNYKGASDADVVSFIEFMVLDTESEQQQTDLKGGLMWLDRKSTADYGVTFKAASNDQQKQILDSIAYYDPKVPQKERPFEVNFFSWVRNMTMTGFYTSKIGIEELGYKGNMPNVWDGVPQEILDQHGVAYDPEWLAKCVDQSKRNITAEWDDEGNLLT